VITDWRSFQPITPATEGEFAAEAAEIGNEIFDLPRKGPQHYRRLKHIAGEFNRYGAICKKNVWFARTLTSRTRRRSATD